MKSTNSFPLATILCLALFVTSGCQWVDRDMNTLAVWSDDDSAQAYMRAQWEEKQSAYPYPAGAAQRRNYKHSVYVQQPNGSGRAKLYGPKSGIPGTQLYYVRSQGYVIASVTNFSGNATRFDRVHHTSGQATTIIESDAPTHACGTLAVVPSPGGQTLAVIERSGQGYDNDNVPPSPGGLCADGTVSVSFVDIDSLQTSTSFAWVVDREIEYTWDPAGKLYVGTYQTMWHVDPISGPELTERPDCMEPRTTSSNVSASGALIAPSGDGGSNTPVELVIESVAESQRFGCQ